MEEGKDSVFDNALNNDEVFFNAKDYSDIVLKDKNKKRTMILVTIFFLIIIIGGAIFFILSLINSTEDNNSYVVPQSEVEYQQSNDYIENINKPLEKLYPTAPTVEHRVIDVNVENGKIIAGENKLTIKNVPIEKTEVGCEVTEPTDFCLAGLAKFDKQDINIYFMNDLINSRLFENPEQFKELSVEGSPAAAAIVIEMGGEKGVVLAVANTNSSGYMIAVPDSMSMDQINSLASQITVQ